MITIQNEFLKKEFEAFSKLQSKDEKQALLETASKRFDSFSEQKQQEIQQDWINNVEQIGNRLNEIGDRVMSLQTLEVYPTNKEEVRLLEMILKKMNIRFALK